MEYPYSKHINFTNTDERYGFTARLVSTKRGRNTDYKLHFETLYSPHTEDEQDTDPSSGQYKPITYNSIPILSETFEDAMKLWNEPQVDSVEVNVLMLYKDRKRNMNSFLLPTESFGKSIENMVATQLESDKSLYLARKKVASSKIPNSDINRLYNRAPGSVHLSRRYLLPIAQTCLMDLESKQYEATKILLKTLYTDRVGENMKKEDIELMTNNKGLEYRLMHDRNAQVKKDLAVQELRLLEGSMFKEKEGEVPKTILQDKFDQLSIYYENSVKQTETIKKTFLERFHARYGSGTDVPMHGDKWNALAKEYTERSKSSVLNSSQNIETSDSSQGQLASDVHTEKESNEIIGSELSATSKADTPICFPPHTVTKRSKLLRIKPEDMDWTYAPTSESNN
ncbi:uncharacterized protein L201_007258 [Kwoniella dendrophila CBS 6074]|uniref:Uncharacterized protein n=1 Tax=Kwoniella dendrophila CBS 6074 TaxID=1295534 RepID=A0AAX4K585_9TREE